MCVVFFLRYFSQIIKRMSKELNSERLRDKSDKLHWLHEYLLDTYRFVCRSIFSNKNLIHFTTSGIRKVPDHLDGGQDRFISRLESGEPDHHCRRRLRLYRRLVVLVKGEIRGRKRRERERERENSFHWMVRITVVSTTVQVSRRGCAYEADAFTLYATGSLKDITRTVV